MSASATASATGSTTASASTSAKPASPRPQRIGVLSFAHYHANFWSEVFAKSGALEGIWDADAARGRENRPAIRRSGHDGSAPA
jgi:hypothetical protein